LISHEDFSELSIKTENVIKWIEDRVVYVKKEYIKESLTTVWDEFIIIKYCIDSMASIFNSLSENIVKLQTALSRTDASSSNAVDETTGMILDIFMKIRKSLEIKNFGLRTAKTVGRIQVLTSLY